MVDVKIKSEDAVFYTSNDLDADGYPKGPFSDPYLFAPPLTLADLSKPDDTGTDYIRMTFTYYSRWGEFADHPYELLCRLEPGQIIDFTYGVFVTDAQVEGGRTNLSTLAVACLSNDTFTFVPLYLDGE